MIKNLRQIRKARRLTQQALSQLANVNRINISQYENGVKNPNLATAEKLATALDVTVDELIGKEDAS